MCKKLPNYLAIVCMSLVLMSTVNAQEPLKHEKKIYKAPNGKIYIQKELPIYLRVATSPDENAETFLLHSEETKAYSNPMYLDTEGYNTFRAPSAVDTTTKKTVYPIRDIIFEVYSDSKSPITHINYGKTKTHVQKGKVYINGHAKITLNAKDEMSGVENVYFSLDGKAYAPYTDTIILKEEREYTLKYYSVDNVGNVEEVKDVTLELDNSRPVTEIKFDGDIYENILSGRASINLNPDDQGIGVSKTIYSIDGGAEKIYKYPIQTKYLSQGDHKLTYYTVDKVNNEEDVKVYDFYIDKTPPTIVQEVMGKSFMANGQEFSSGRSKLKLTTFDNKAGVKEVFYSINGAEYVLYDKPFYLSNSSGNLSVKTYAVDNVNNKSQDDEEESARSSIPYIDLSGPSLAHRFSGPMFFTRDTAFISPETKIILTAKDPESGLSKIEYSIDTGNLQVYDAPFNITAEGVHEIFFNGYDNVDNSNRSKLTVIVDSSGPEIFSRFSATPVNHKEDTTGTIDVYPRHVVLFLSATDVKVGFDKMFYMQNSSYEKPYTGIINTFDKSNDIQLIKIKAIDKLGNTSIDSLKFGLD